jgi:hypothetical protein
MKPMFSRWGVNKQVEETLWMAANSLYHLKSFNKKVVLHTDEPGKRISGQLPYDAVYTTLNSLIDADNTYWAHGKFVAYANTPVPFCHVDMDAYIQKKELIDLIEAGDYDILTQSKTNIHDEELASIFRYLLDKIPESLSFNYYDTKYPWSFSCPVCAIADEELKQAYIKGYEYMYEYFKPLHLFDDGLVPDILWEEHFLAYLTHKLQKREKFLTKHWSDSYLLYEQTGFYHEAGIGKYNNIEGVKLRLRDSSPELFQKADYITTNLGNIYAEFSRDMAKNEN